MIRDRGAMAPTLNSAGILTGAERQALDES
jgi:hypothetical protein